MNEKIIELYGTMTVLEISIQLNLTKDQVANRIKKLKTQGLLKNKFRHWSADDINYLKDNYVNGDLEEIATLTKRTVAEVITKASYLGLKRRAERPKEDVLRGEWRKVNIEGLSHYLINRLGTIVDSKGNVYKSRLNEHGYLVVSLKCRLSNRNVVRKVHRLVAFTYIPYTLPIPINDATVNHKDLDKLNNSDTNLEWMTLTDNIEHAVRNGANTLISDNTKATDELVKAICRLIKNGKSNKSIVCELSHYSLDLNLSDLVSRIRNKRAWTKISEKYF